MKSQIFLVLALSITPLVNAQDSTSLEKARLLSESTARAKASKAYERVEAYGRSQTPVRTSDKLRELAWQRLLGELQKDKQKSQQKRPLREIYEELKKYRAAALARLAQLDPDRYSPERERSEEPEKLIHKSYDVTDLIIQAPDHETGNVGLGVGLDEDGAGAALAFGDSEDEYAFNLRIDPDSLFEFVQALAGPETENQVEFSKGHITANQPLSVHKKIENLLSKLRRQRGRLIRVEVQALKMKPMQFVKFSAKNSLTKEQEQELEKLIDSGAIIRQYKESAIAYDGQKISIRKGATLTAVADIEVNQTGVVPVLNPVVVSIREGLLAELRPHFNLGDKVVELEMSLSLTELDKDTEKRKVYSGRINNDIEAAKSLPAHELELAKMKLSRQTTTAVVPVGRGAIITGVASNDNSDEVTTAIYVHVTIVDNKD